MTVIIRGRILTEAIRGKVSYAGSKLPENIQYTRNRKRESKEEGDYHEVVHCMRVFAIRSSLLALSCRAKPKPPSVVIKQI